MDAESADMEVCVCIYEVQLSYPSPVPGVIQLLAGHSRKKKKKNLLPPVGPHCFLSAMKYTVLFLNLWSLKVLDSCSASPFLFEHLPSLLSAWQGVPSLVLAKRHNQFLYLCKLKEPPAPFLSLLPSPSSSLIQLFSSFQG